MKYPFSLFAALWLATFAFAACSSDKKEDPTPPVATAQAGKLQGQITPAAAITTVTATDSLNRPTTTTPSATGAYVFAILAAGRYTLSFTPASGYIAPATQRVTVSAGGTTTATPTQVAQVAQSNDTGTLIVDGTSYPVDAVRGRYSSGDLFISIMGAGAHLVSLHITDYTGVAQTGPIGGLPSNSDVFYTEPINIGTTASSADWATTIFPGPSPDTFTVTPTGTNPARVSGSFSCTAQPYSSNATGARVISGTFTNVAY